MKSADLVKFQQRIGYSFDDPEILKRAFVHASADGDDNDRLEFLGDAALGFAVSELMYERFANVDVGVLTVAKGNLVNNEVLSDVAIELGIVQLMSLGESVTQNTQNRSKVFADALEAVIGAIVVDGGMDSVRKFVNDHVAADFDLDKVTDKHPKSSLQEWTASRGYQLPFYRTIRHEYVPGGEHWQVTCTIRDLSARSFGEGRSKRDAETEAAKDLLQQLASTDV